MDFISSTEEKGDFNQYWYSQHTTQKIIDELERQCTTVAFVSTPSVYFSLSEESPLRQHSKVLDFDTQWEDDPAFVFYDFHDPDRVPQELLHTFDGIVVDPPFITMEVWEKYARTAKLLLKDGGKIICTTIAENADMMQKLLDLKQAPFKPFIPNLVYRYSLYLNFEPEILAESNQEVPE